MEDIELKNGKILWQRLKDEFEEQEHTDCYFYKDYLENEKDIKHFLSELKEQESWLDLTKEVTDEDYDQLYNHIEEAIFGSAIVSIRINKFLGR